MKRAEFPTSRESVSAIIDSCFMDGKLIRNAKSLPKEQRKALRQWVASFDSSNAVKSEKYDTYLKARKILGMRFFVKRGTEEPVGVDPADIFIYDEKVNLLHGTRELTAYVVLGDAVVRANGELGVTARYLSEVACAVSDTGEVARITMGFRRKVARIMTEARQKYNEEDGYLPLFEDEERILPTAKAAKNTFVPFEPDKPEQEEWEFGDHGDFYDDEAMEPDPFNEPNIPDEFD